MKKTALLISILLIILTKNNVFAQNTLSDALLLFQKSGNNNQKFYTYDANRLQENIFISSIQEENGLLNITFNIGNTDNRIWSKHLLFITENMAISYGDFEVVKNKTIEEEFDINATTFQGKTADMLSSGDILMLIDDQIVVTSFPLAFFKKEGQYEKYAFEQAAKGEKITGYARSIFSLQKPTDFGKKYKVVTDKINLTQLQQYADKIYTEFAALIKKEMTKEGTTIITANANANRVMEKNLPKTSLHKKIIKKIIEESKK